MGSESGRDFMYPRRQMREVKSQYGVEHLRCVVIGTLDAPATCLSAPKTCTVAVLKFNSATEMLETTDGRKKVYNFTPGLTASDGTYALIRLLDVWEIYWVDCLPSSDATGLAPTPTPEVGGI